jgi:hypothetical protein
MKDAFVYSDNWLATHLFAMAPQSERETMRYARAILVHQRSGDIDVRAPFAHKVFYRLLTSILEV